MSSDRLDAAALLGPIRRIHERVRDAVVAQCERAALEELSGVADDESQGDTIYAIDRVSEECSSSSLNERSRVTRRLS